MGGARISPRRPTREPAMTDTEALNTLLNGGRILAIRPHAILRRREHKLPSRPKIRIIISKTNYDGQVDSMRKGYKA